MRPALRAYFVQEADELAANSSDTESPPNVAQMCYSGIEAQVGSQDQSKRGGPDVLETS